MKTLCRLLLPMILPLSLAAAEKTYPLPAPAGVIVTDEAAFAAFAAPVIADAETMLAAGPAPAQAKLILPIRVHYSLHTGDNARALDSAARIKARLPAGADRDYAGLTTQAFVAARQSAAGGPGTPAFLAAFGREFASALGMLPVSAEMRAVLQQQRDKFAGLGAAALQAETATLAATLGDPTVCTLAEADQFVRLRHRFADLLPLRPVLLEELDRAIAGRLPGTVPQQFFQGAALHNIVQVEPAGPGEGFRLCRVPAELWGHLNERAKVRAYAPGGAELRFNPGEGGAKLTLRYVEDRAEEVRGWPVLAEIWQGDYFVRWVEIRDTWTEILIVPPGNAADLAAAARGSGRFDSALVRVVLPYAPEIRLLKLEGAVTPPRPGQLPARRYLAYGSSITNGFYAVRPGETYPARLARALGTDVINLGFGGGAHLEPEMADWIAGRTDWDFATLELGVNLLARLSPDEFRQRVDYFLPAIARAHPDRWIFVIDIFGSGKDLTEPVRVEAFRQVVRERVAKIASPKVVYLNGQTLLTDLTGLTGDLLHPSAEGFAEIARRLEAEIRANQGTAVAVPAPRTAP